jgi:hypothetical protein
MTVQRKLRFAATATATAVGLAAVAYTGLVARAWRRYGHPRDAGARERDPALDRFMPSYDVVERHRITVRAPARVTLAAAKSTPLQQIPAVRAIFRAREIILGAVPDQRRPRGLLDETRALGWGILEDIADREVIVGAATRPWEANVTFRSIAPDAFAAFNEPGYVKIAWTLRATPIDDGSCVFMTETRAVATDRDARRRFRRYWAFVSPGINLIRWLALEPVKAEAERRAQAERARPVAV